MKHHRHGFTHNAIVLVVGVLPVAIYYILLSGLGIDVPDAT